MSLFETQNVADIKNTTEFLYDVQLKKRLNWLNTRSESYIDFAVKCNLAGNEKNNEIHTREQAYLTICALNVSIVTKKKIHKCSIPASALISP